MKSTIKITWEEYNNIINNLTEKILDSGLSIKEYSIAGIERGGLIPAIHLSYKLGINNFISIDKFLYIPPNRFFKNLLVVDDIYHSGKTVNDFMRNNSLRLINGDVKMITLYKNIVGEGKDLWLYEKSCNEDEWIVFPWENSDEDEENLKELEEHNNLVKNN